MSQNISRLAKSVRSLKQKIDSDEKLTLAEIEALAESQNALGTQNLQKHLQYVEEQDNTIRRIPVNRVWPD